ncbi:outer membrane beta-barrel protein [Ferruginibacter sp. SUN106]|uniref:outer membrane beta-barrel protein n=1 Tax=Ferruginibacter sp. SUN106 TaxID=2978348 RepID=UPI003D3626E1
MKFVFSATFLFLFFTGNAQKDTSKPKGNPGIIVGSVQDNENAKAVASATVTLTKIADTGAVKTFITAKDGSFLFDQLAFGYYRVQLSMVGYNNVRLDSIYIRAERFDFDLNEIKLHRRSTDMDEVIVYAEKPIIENKDGKIIFNVGESALSAGSSTTELLKQAPLVNVDNDGKVQMRGKDVKILIDDKPVELNGKQLQDLLESMPGSMIDKIEVMTTPPPQYANERGGVINIVTKKGRVGKSGRIGVSYGTRGENGINGSFSYRKNKIALNASAGFGYNAFEGSSYSNRQNIYTDSINYFNTIGNNSNDALRPNARLSLDYDMNKHHAFNFTTYYNSSNTESNSNNQYANINSGNLIYKLSNRAISTNSTSSSPSFNATYTAKGKLPTTVFKIITGVNFGSNDNERDYYQQYLNPDYSFTGTDSSQQQDTKIKNSTVSIRLNYDRLLKNNKFFLNLGNGLIRANNHNILNTAFLKKPDNIFIKNELLSNDIEFHQNVFFYRAALRYTIVPDFNVTAGAQVEQTTTKFNLVNDTSNYANNYWSPLPFVTIIKKWENDVNITASYKRSIQRPGLNQLNPSVDYSDPYNTRFGNPYLQPYFADNFDFIIGKWNKLYYANVSVGYNELKDIYSSIRTLQPDGKTTTTWQNLSGRKEYEANTWGGYTINKKAKVNISLGYTYNVYSIHDRTVNRYHNGGSVFSTFNGSYQFNDLLNSNASVTFNRFANPQGTVRSTLSMNIGVQQKFFKKKMILSVSMIDPFRQQQNKFFTYAGNFNLESYSTTKTKNFRIAVSYLFSKKVKKINKPDLLKKAGVKM